MITAILVAGGSGLRMGGSVDKLFIEVAGRPLMAHTWERLDRCSAIDEIIVVARAGSEPVYAQLAKRFEFAKPFRLTAGGAQRQDSVWNGLQAANSATEIVVIQDAARPRAPEQAILDTIKAARKIGAAVAGHPMIDTVKESGPEGLVARTLDRSLLWAVQTPQTFRFEVLRKALAAVREAGQSITDDTAACEFIGQPVQLVECLSPNPKLTRPGDLAYLETLLRSEKI